MMGRYFVVCHAVFFCRFFIEGLRIDSLMFGPIRVAQGISAIAFIVSLIILAHNRRVIEI